MRIILSHGQSLMSTDDTEDHIIIHLSSNWKGTPRRGKRNIAQGRASVTSGTLGIGHLHTLRPESGSRERWNGSYGNAFRMFPIAPVGRGPSGCILPRVSLHFVSLCPGLGSSCPFGAFTANRIPMRPVFTTTGTTQLGHAFPYGYCSRCPCLPWKNVCMGILYIPYVKKVEGGAMFFEKRGTNAHYRKKCVNLHVQTTDSILYKN